jgi:hypothetical protein
VQAIKAATGEHVAKPERQIANTNAMIWRFIGPMTGKTGILSYDK